MKRTLLALTLATVTSTAFSATSADLLLKGVVAPILEVSIAHETLASNLPLDRQVNSEKVGTITEKSNSPTGYKIKARSAKGGKLVNAADQNSYVQYTLTYQGSNVPLNTSATEVYSTANIRGTNSKDLKISYNQPSNLSAGSYEDTVTFTIEAN
ncbi:hypothetical protein [Peredibacter starrii]|uniref:Fimbrial protein n=1 Tax=Peredibacter starrii TaxID=28202 RepID=A0AAX4HKW9_9BACT|nr:hypothetical protein [Peredibacter starrii]WPU63914.1 hypothetical protein SOO65_14560 [Peredibacter starrii]